MRTSKQRDAISVSDDDGCTSRREACGAEFKRSRDAAGSWQVPARLTWLVEDRATGWGKHDVREGPIWVDDLDAPAVMCLNCKAATREAGRVDPFAIARADPNRGQMKRVEPFLEGRPPISRCPGSGRSVQKTTSARGNDQQLVAGRGPAHLRQAANGHGDKLDPWNAAKSALYGAGDGAELIVMCLHLRAPGIEHAES